jgi:phospholipid/cholesterol/gamma-HCH transport system permease protein
VSSVVAMVLAYLSVYGFRWSAFDGFTRTLGQIFSPGVMMIFGLKTLLFSLAVALIPVVAAVREAGDGAGTQTRTNAALGSLVRLFSVILLIEVASLMSNYA